MSRNSTKVVSYNSLLHRNQISCEFCELIFTNRYESIVHNATHIIIPLQKLDILQCNKCIYQCVFQKDLDQHVIFNHPLLIKSERLSFCDENIPLKSEEIIDKNIKIFYVKSEEGSDNSPGDSENESVSCNGTYVTNGDTINGNITINGHGFENSRQQYSLNNIPLRERLLFETDYTSSNVGYYEELHFEGEQSKAYSDLKLDCSNAYKAIPNNDVDNATGDYNSILTVSFSNYDLNKDSLREAVSYDDLKMPVPSTCRYCEVVFPSRLSLIIHEWSHVNFVRHISGSLCIHCDKYIAGNYDTLWRHMQASHANINNNVHSTGDCDMCGLSYRSYRQHVLNYHPLDRCDLRSTRDEFGLHLAKCPIGTHEAVVCKKCYKCLQTDSNMKCIKLGTKHNETYEQCRRCDKRVLVVKRVKLTAKKRRAKTRPISNEERLRNIQMRMKKLKIMRKYL